jgi:hypothetical protein
MPMIVFSIPSVDILGSLFFTGCKLFIALALAEKPDIKIIEG